MSAAARHLVAELEGMGLRMVWGAKGTSLSGDLGKLKPEHVEGLRAHRKELEALTRWRHLQDESEARYGHPAARLYPFLANPCREFWKAPRIRTPLGRAHLVQVLDRTARVALAKDVKAWLEEQAVAKKPLPFSAKAHLVNVAEVWPPSEPPR